VYVPFSASAHSKAKSLCQTQAQFVQNFQNPSALLPNHISTADCHGKHCTKKTTPRFEIQAPHWQSPWLSALESRSRLPAVNATATIHFLEDGAQAKGGHARYGTSIEAQKIHREHPARVQFDRNAYPEYQKLKRSSTEPN
jgi:hypothetical protein